jgi:SAM-dependent methyltransferase
VSLDDIDFDAVYRGESAIRDADITFEKVPWDIDEPQPVLVELESSGGFQGQVLDIGCGLGNNATFLAGRGHNVTGVDGSPNAIEQATARAAARNTKVEFRVGDATRLDGLAGRFDTVLDSALYHCLTEDNRVAYAAALHRACKPAAQLHLFCFADELVGKIPFAGTVSQDNLRANLGEHWDITSIDATDYTTVFTPDALQRIYAQMAIGFDPASVRTDEHNRVLFPIWRLRATRA